MTIRPQPLSRVDPPIAAEKHTMVWLLGVVVVLIACQIALLFESLSPLRVVFRSAAFAASLAALVVVVGRPGRHPSRMAAGLVGVIVSLGFFHPNTSSALAAIGSVALYTAILAPVFWVPRLDVSRRVFGRLIILLWGFHTLSATFGVLQVYFPGQFQPAVSQVVLNSQFGGDNLKVMLASGEQVYRPMGLTDMPGGASTAGKLAFLLGLGMFAVSRHLIGQLVGLAGMPIGLFCIYLSQVRSHLILCGLLAICFLAALVATRRYVAAVRVAVVVPVVAVAAFIWAVALGGEATTKRFETLLQGNPDEVYHQNRGIFLEHTIRNLLPQFPFGAGLGRWGMINSYFGDPTNPNATPIWAEIQWTGWILDGGVPLVFAYCVAILGAIWATARVALRASDPWLSGWAMLIVAYDMAMLASTFGAIPFIGQAGLEFWLLNAAVYAAGRQVISRPKRIR
jgi:hypothetical protein